MNLPSSSVVSTVDSPASRDFSRGKSNVSQTSYADRVFPPPVCIRPESRECAYEGCFFRLSTSPIRPEATSTLQKFHTLIAITFTRSSPTRRLSPPSYPFDAGFKLSLHTCCVRLLTWGFENARTTTAGTTLSGGKI